MLGCKNNSISKTAIFVLAVVFAFGLASGAQAKFAVDFAQGANAHNTVGDVYWIRGILQQNNSIHYEGMSTLQRIIFLDIPPSSDPRGSDWHTLILKHLANKSADHHAYDFVTSWPQAVDAANAIGGPGLFVTINECGAKIGPPNNLDDICEDLHATGHTAYFDAPDAMGSLLGDDVAARVAAYEAIFGNRTVKIYGEAPFSGLSMSFDGYSGSGDMLANYTLTWQSASTSIVIEMAGHLAAGVDPLGAGIGYGEGRGAAAISGGPYHFKLEFLDDISIGSQDNQIKAGAILVPSPIVCEASGDEVCVGEDATLTGSASGGDPGSYTYCWKKDLAGPCIGTSANLVIPNAQLSDAGTYYFIVCDQYYCAAETCQAELIVHGAPVCEADGDEVCVGEDATLTGGASGGDPGSYTYCWKKDLAGPCIGTGPTLTIPDAQLTDAGTYYLIVDDQYHCEPGTCSADLVVCEPGCELACPDPPPVCGSSGNTLTATITGPFAIVDYFWTLTATGWYITGGQGTPTITYTASSALWATFKLVVTDEFGGKDSCEIICRCEPCPHTTGGGAAKLSAGDGSASASLPKEFSLSQSYPNPFNPSCVIAYALPADCHVTLNVYNMLGQKVRVLVDEHQSAGHKSATWDGKDADGRELSTGIYFYRIEAGDFEQSKKMVFIK
jgi:hypothetical protein